ERCRQSCLQVLCLQTRYLQTGLSASRFDHEIENAKQPRIVSPHSNKLESDFAGERGKFFLRVFVGILGGDLFAPTEMELVFVKMNKLIDFADEIHFDATGTRIVDGSMPPLIQIEICANFAIHVR